MAFSKEAPVLIVDDSLAIRARMESYLRRMGFPNIATASSVEEGLKAFRENRPELVFLDLVIDDERGTEFAAQALEERPETHISLMTALPPSHEFVTAAIAEGARDYLQKPIQFAQLKRVVDRIMEGRDDQLATDHPDASYV